MTNDLESAKLSEQEVAAFATTLVKMVRGFGGFMLLAIAAMGGITAIPYINPPGEQAVLDTIGNKRAEIEAVVRPGKWTKDMDRDAMTMLRGEMSRKHELMWREITANTADRRGEKSREHLLIQDNARRINNLGECCD